MELIKIFGRRGNGLGFFFAMLLISALLGGMVVLVGVKYTGLGATILPQSIADQQTSDSPPQAIKASRSPVITSEQSSSAKALEQATINVAKTVGPAVVMISTLQEQTLDYFFRPVTQQLEGVGSGVIFRSDGYILTNNHVIASQSNTQGGIQITVVLKDGRQFKGQVVGSDALTDLAVVKIDGQNLPTATLGNSDSIQVGQFAVAIGNPLGTDLQNTVTMGVISAVDRTLTTEDNTILRGVIQTDASINPGNSGGPLLNSDGEVVGINTAIVTGAQGIGFAIPINTAKEIAQELIAHGRVSRPGLGITYSPIDEQSIAWLESATGARVPVDSGALITEVTKGSGADAAGLGRYDLLTEIDGNKIDDSFDLAGYVAGRKVGDKLDVVYYRLTKGTLGRYSWKKNQATIRVDVVQ